MMDYEAVRERQDTIRRNVERRMLALSASGPQRRPLRISIGTGLARLGMLLAGRTAVRAALGEAR